MVPDVGYSFYFRAAAGFVKVVYYNPAAPTTTPIIIPSSNQIRYVLIPGGALAASVQANGSTCEQEVTSLRSMSYSEVCRKYGVPQ